MINDVVSGEERMEKGTGMELNFSRVLDRVLRYWYLVVLSLLTGLAIAYLINRYSTRIYPVKASIIIRESEENAGAKFLYDNALINQSRNFYNEIYIMKSYPLLQQVVEELNFNVSFYREGNIKTTEYYDPDFPVEFRRLEGFKMPEGRSLTFKVNADHSYSLGLLDHDEAVEGKKFENLHFNDTVKINGYRFYVYAKANVGELVDKLFIVRFNDAFSIARSYSDKLLANWAQVGASVVNLEVKGNLPLKEIRFLNKFIEKYQLYDIEKKNRVATMAIKFLDEQLSVIGDSLTRYEDQVEDFKHRNIITNLDAETNRLYIKLQQLEDQIFQFQLKENYYDYITKLLTSDQYDGIFTPTSVGVSDNVIASLITRLIEARAMMNQYQGIEKRDENPIFQGHLETIKRTKSDILQTIDNTRKTEAINIEFIREQIKVIEKELSKLPRSERELIDIERNYSLKEKLYVLLLQKRTEAGLSKASTTSDIVLVNPPLAERPVSPKITQNYLLAGVGGIAFPLIIFVLLELFNTKIQSREDIEKNTGIPVIGGIGHNPSRDALVVYRKPRSAMSESFRALRSNLNYFTGNKDHQVFTITSSVPGEGKSFTTINLATVFAMTGKKTLIVGADLRKPKLYGDLNLNNEVGLSQYLSGMTESHKIIQSSEIENLFLIPGGPMPPNPSELLLRPQMATLMDELRSQFDFIIIDTPPLAYVADAFILSQFSDHTLFVVRQDYTPKAALHTLEELYSTGKLANASILFNDLRRSGYGYGYGPGYSYGYGYNYYYGYGKKRRPDSGDGYYSE